MKRNKKASLSLSINAIVILVLAITMLGLGLGFTKGMFGKLGQRLSVPEPDIPATADDKIVLPSDKLEITKNKEFIFSVNVYNDDFTGKVSGSLTCPVDPNDSECLGFTATAPGQEIDPAEDKGFKFIITKDKVTTSCTRVCTIAFTDTATTPFTESKQVVVAVK